MKDVAYVPHDRVQQYVDNGWSLVDDLSGTRHGVFSVIMERPHVPVATVRQSTKGVFVVLHEARGDIYLRVECAEPDEARDRAVAHRVADCLNSVLDK